jgi:CDP-diacylglycerol--glycerol-3-phosphate 3-phosphatidyltransferase
VLDGFVARKTNSSSSFGAKADTVADFIFTLVMLIKILSVINVPKYLWAWIIVIAIIKISNIIFGLVCKKKFMAEHTLLNKVTGVLLFLLPLSLFYVELKYGAIAVCVAATISAIQEGYYIVKGQEIF